MTTEIVLSSLWSEGPAVQGSSTGESAETMTLFRNDVERQELQESMPYEQRSKD